MKTYNELLLEGSQIAEAIEMSHDKVIQLHEKLSLEDSRRLSKNIFHLVNEILMNRKNHSETPTLIGLSEKGGMLSWGIGESAVDKRIRASAIKCIRAVAPDTCNVLEDHFLRDIMTYALSKLYCMSLAVEALNGDDLLEVYASGYAFPSCLTGRDSQRTAMLSFLSQNPDKVSIIKFHSEADVRARALLWTTDSGKKVLDRIYPNDSRLIPLIIEWCEANEYIMRKNNSAAQSFRSVKLSDGKYYKVTMTCTTHCIEVAFPYLDTFTFSDFEEKDKIWNEICELKYQHDSDTIKRKVFDVTLTNKYCSQACFLTTCGFPFYPDPPEAEEYSAEDYVEPDWGRYSTQVVNWIHDPQPTAMTGTAPTITTTSTSNRGTVGTF